MNDGATSSFNNGSHPDPTHLNLPVNGGDLSRNRMGNLADELADAFSESGDEDECVLDEQRRMTANEFLQNHNKCDLPTSVVQNINPERIHGDAEANGDNFTTQYRGSHVKRCSSQKGDHYISTGDYNGSDIESGSDLDATGIPSTLQAKIDDIESLAQRGTEGYGWKVDDVFKRVTDGLRGLGSQSTVEGSASSSQRSNRLITAHSALTTHLTHQTRQLQRLSFPILSPLASAPDIDTIDKLVPLLLSLSECMPRPWTSAFNSLTALHCITSDLIQTLNYVSDSLHMSRQTTATATRRLRSVREIVTEIRRDEELREQGERWLTRGNWGDRLQKRECAGVCGEVMGGFEDVCNDWRMRLLAQAESQA
ncbi:hypothetical protein RJ55_08727 [Drechmeria coniospora]|nr:hypothetical protein RJ55_08727 [Drechmeria coniospora]